MTDRPADVISAITDEALPDKVSLADARAAGRFGHDKPTVENSVVLLIDHQIGLLASTRDTSSAAELKSNIVGLARVAKALELPTLITSSNAHWQNGDVLPEIKELFPETPIIRRTGIINAYEDPTFRAAFDKIVEETGRDHVILAGVTIGTCTLFPTLSLQNDGYVVYPVIDAAGAWNRYEADAAIARMVQAGAQPVSTFALACELQADWKKPWANAMLEPFNQNLSEYGYVLQNFWNNYGNKVVADPFA
ncbi:MULTISPECIES: isochorismatase family protein [unclassified Nocardioides]|uniref:isochorismatase family protein n=1 Tax=unclassified Nocardioides TaxID=2615069 RepID=UPI00005718CA|nr:MULTISPECIES: isochorismatase family protein [unclassified Nocardioides]ABL82709.1 isochorismatase hydrolase [Nocardioides sp. JS614]